MFVVLKEHVPHFNGVADVFFFFFGNNAAQFIVQYWLVEKISLN